MAVASKLRLRICTPPAWYCPAALSRLRAIGTLQLCSLADGMVAANRATLGWWG
jgi:hypothetical protein